MTAADNAALLQPWQDLWNGNLAIADSLIADGFVSHAASLLGGPATDTTGRDALKGWITGALSLFHDFAFVIDVGPICDDQHLVVRWKASGVYGGGFPGASPDAVGRRVTFYGTDTLRVADGQLAEYWANADSLWLIQQLGVTQVPPL